MPLRAKVKSYEFRQIYYIRNPLTKGVFIVEISKNHK